MFETLLEQSLKLKDYIKYSLKNSINFNALMGAFQIQIDYILLRLDELIHIFDIQRAKGSGLDFIGLIIGQPRITTIYVNNNLVFDTRGKGFDDGIFDAGGNLISDEDYRFLLNAKILKNNTKYWSREDIIKYHQTLLGVENKFEVIEDVLKVDLIFKQSLANFKRQTLNNYGIEISGVKINYEVPL